MFIEWYRTSKIAQRHVLSVHELRRLIVRFLAGLLISLQSPLLWLHHLHTCNENLPSESVCKCRVTEEWPYSTVTMSQDTILLSPSGSQWLGELACELRLMLIITWRQSLGIIHPFIFQSRWLNHGTSVLNHHWSQLHLYIVYAELAWIHSAAGLSVATEPHQ